MTMHTWCVSGSSPRMRGAPVGYDQSQRWNRIIPAYAGSTVDSHSWQSLRRDHPRVCGEHQPWRYEYTRRSGSSPRMRGAHTRATLHQTTFGIIPAYAGSAYQMPL